MPSTRKSAARTVLVTGGAGFIGSHVVDALLARGTEVRVLDDLSSGSADTLPLHDPNLELQVGSVDDLATVRAAMHGAHACIHLAARRGPARLGIDPYRVTLGNVLGFINVLDAAREHHVARVLYASSAAVYGEAPQTPFTEATEPRPVRPEGIDKLLAEGYAELFSRQHGLNALGLRYFNVYGPRQSRDRVVPRFLELLNAHRPVAVRGNGHQRRDFIHVEDAARATVAALDADCRGTLNVASGHATPIRELVQLLGLALDLRPLMHFVPAAAGETADCCADIRRLREATGFAPTYRLRAGLAALAGDRAARRRRAEGAPECRLRPLAADLRQERLAS